jgi:predicted PurR-regulated permease PerM
MNPLLYLKAVIGAVGANVFPPIADWLVSFIPAPRNVHTALSILLVALLTGGAVYASPNKQKA